MFPFHSNREDRPWFVALTGIALALGAAFLASAWFQGSVRAESAGAIALGSFLLALTATWVYQLAARLTNCLGGAMAACLLLANGGIVEAFMAETEAGAFIALTVGALLGLAAWLQDERLAGQGVGLLCLALLPLVRPEGTILVLATSVVLLARRDKTPPLSPWKALLCLVPFAAWLILNRMDSGRVSPLDVWGESEAAPFWGWVGRIGQTLTEAIEQFSGVAGVLGVLALFGGGLAVLVESRARRPSAASLLFVVWLAGFLALPMLTEPFADQGGALVTLMVLSIPLGILGTKRISSLFPAYEEAAFKAIGLALLLLMTPSLFSQASAFGRVVEAPALVEPEAGMQSQEPRRFDILISSVDCETTLVLRMILPSAANVTSVRLDDAATTDELRIPVIRVVETTGDGV